MNQTKAPMIAGVLAILVVLCVPKLAQPAFAHPLDVGYLVLDANGATLSVALELDVSTAAHAIDVAPDTMNATTVPTQAAKLANFTYRSAPLTTDLGACHWTLPSAALSGRTVKIAGQAECPSGMRTIRWAFPFIRQARLPSTFQLLVKAHLGGDEYVTIVDKSKPQIELSTTALLGFGEFVWSGIEHIGVAPKEWRTANGYKLPDGIDHILFLLAMMLTGGRLLQLVGIASGFTLGHSITLALSALDVVRPSSTLIEPLIALSIAVVAAEAFFGKFQQHRWKVASSFGLIHGFGFANALNRLDLSTRDTVTALFGYNVGIELGQLAIVFVTAPLALLLQRHPRVQPYVVRSLAATIFLAGMYWFAVRLPIPNA